MSKVKLATVWLDGCSGCHMSFLDMDERLLELAELVDVVYSPIVDTKEFPDEVDIALVEGSLILPGKVVLRGAMKGGPGTNASNMPPMQLFIVEMGKTRGR